MPRGLTDILVWGGPGLVVYALGWIVTAGRLIRARDVSLMGARLRYVGLGLTVLGWILDGAVRLAGRGMWASALTVVLLTIWAPLAAFWLASQVRVRPQRD